MLKCLAHRVQIQDTLGLDADGLFVPVGSRSTPQRAHALAGLAARGFDPERDMLHVPPLLNACKQRDDRLAQIAVFGSNRLSTGRAIPFCGIW